MIEINFDNCTGCGYCALVCPFDAIVVSGKAEVTDKCFDCLECIAECQANAIAEPSSKKR
jgi:NAD-dependent dihydropyrimidine dehydrogenase PreA subunit